MQRNGIIAVVVAICFCWACSKSDDNPVSGTGRFHWFINGTHYYTDNASASTGAALQINATKEATQTLQIGLGNVNATGLYNIGSANANNYTFNVQNGRGGYVANASQGGMVVNVRTISATNISGDFNGNLADVSGGGLTNVYGEFNIPRQ
jgi:hypothetical protein